MYTWDVERGAVAGDWKDRKVFVSDLNTIYQAPTREAAEANLVKLGNTWRIRSAMQPDVAEL